jgi:hypothetical protein
VSPGTPEARLRDIGTRVGITERAANELIGDLERAGYIGVRRIGRRNHYELLRSSAGVAAYSPAGELVGLFVAEPEGTFVLSDALDGDEGGSKCHRAW